MKLIAFYLPQFHAIPENDAWWGDGFTEWTNTKKAQPLFNGHHQPKTPLNGNYYNLLDEKTLRWQADLANQYRIWGFCMYHYWFKGGKKLLEKPAELLLAKQDIRQNFCFCWANENWTRCWDGNDKEILMEQDYGSEPEWKEHFDYLLPFFQDDRYIKLNGKPVFVIYKPDQIPDLSAMISFWNEQAISHGLPGLCMMAQNPSSYLLRDFDDSKIDFKIQFEPMYTIIKKPISKKNMRSLLFERPVDVLEYLTIKILKKLSLIGTFNDKPILTYSFDRFWKEIVSRKRKRDEFIPGAFTDWDNSARRGSNGMMFLGSSPKKYGKHLRKLIRRCENACTTDFLFITAWNEWAEGSYLEPDEKHGYAYLQATSDAISYNAK